ALVLTGLVGEDPVVEWPIGCLGGGAARARSRLDRLVVRRAALRALARRVVVDEPERAGRHVFAHERRLDGPRELAADGALEVTPDLERDRGVGLAEGP